MPAIEIAQNSDDLAKIASVKIAQLAQQAIEERGQFVISLTGGSTPRALYNLLSHTDLYPIDWHKTQICFGDERCVPPDHPDSNFKMAFETLLEKISIPQQNIHRMPGEIDSQSGAVAYEKTLHQIFPDQPFPSFDLILLGLGEDGHTASLFPDSPVLDQTRSWVSFVLHSSPPLPLVNRLTLTLPAINAARNILFLVAGSAKQRILSQVLFGRTGQQILPAQRIKPANGQLIWLVDRSAAGQI